MGSNYPNGEVLRTRILPVNSTDLGHFNDVQSLEQWELSTTGLEPLLEAARHLKASNIPVGFPTETVYGLGADATRSDAVKGIYKAKGRPSDNPLIIHICDLTMLRSLLKPSVEINGHLDPLPEIYKPLIQRFWPGPLTILLPNPSPSKLAPEVTAGLPSFGARMPASPLALSLIYLAGVPLAAPSANASTKPSPTTAEHVQHDLDGKIEIILDGGACQVGVESTVVDGLCDPPVVLRPGGVSIDSIRECAGWEGVVKGYKDQSEIGVDAPRAPGMKYKHYSPKAKVVLFEVASGGDTDDTRRAKAAMPQELWRIMFAKDQKIPHLFYELSNGPAVIGIVRTRHWERWAGLNDAKWAHEGMDDFAKILHEEQIQTSNPFQMYFGELWQGKLSNGKVPANTRQGILERVNEGWKGGHIANVIEVSLGRKTKDIARGLFSALRELDQRCVDIIFVEGIEDEGDIAAAVMNRLRKAATVIER